ncbi:hypothetical protein GCM10009712_11110 [Pseudarthrobacter sulfonivorans]
MAGTESQWQTPPKPGLFFAHLFASFARVFVAAIPTQTGTPTFRRTALHRPAQREEFGRRAFDAEESLVDAVHLQPGRVGAQQLYW